MSDSNIALDLETVPGPTLMIDGKRIPLESFCFTNNVVVDPPYDFSLVKGIDPGKLEVSGEMTAYFTNPALLDYFRRDIELEQMLREHFAQHLVERPPFWRRALRAAGWVAIAILLLTLSTGAI